MLVTPNAAHSLPFSQWLNRHLYFLLFGQPQELPEPMQWAYHSTVKTTPVTLSPVAPNTDFFSPLFLMTYGIDGYDVSTHIITPAHRHEQGDLQQDVKYHGEPLPKSLMIASFVGLPTRTGCNDTLPSSNTQLPQLTGWGLLKNLIGGWDTLPADPAYREKKIWQYAALPLKIFVILPWKILTIAFKLPINILKVFTELLPEMATERLHLAIADLLHKRTEHLKNPPQHGSDDVIIEHELEDFTAQSHQQATLDGNDDDTSPLLTANEKIVQQENRWWRWPLRWEFSAPSLGKWFQPPDWTLWGYSIVIGALALLHATFRIITLTGRAITSPAKSAKLAALAGHELNRGMSIFLFYLNKTITSVVWAISLPLALGMMIYYIPTVILPLIAWVGNLPVISTSLTAMDGALVSIATFFAMDFATIVESLSLLLHLEVSPAALIIGASIGFFAAPVAIFISKIGDNLSDRWARWHEGGPVTSLWIWRTQKSVNTTANVLTATQGPDAAFPTQPATDENPSDQSTAPRPSPTATVLVTAVSSSLEGAERPITQPGVDINPAEPSQKSTEDSQMGDELNPDEKPIHTLE